MAINRAVYAQRAVVLFSLSVLTILVLNYLQKHGLIDPEFEGLCRLAINGSFGVAILVGAARNSVPKALRLTLILAVSAAVAETFLDFSEDVPSWATIPLIGRESTARRSLESILAAGWMCGGVCVIFMSLRLIQQTQADMKQKIEQLTRSEEELRRSNEQRETALRDLEVTQQQLIRNERLGALGHMASGVAHDLNNALTPAAMYSDVLLSNNDEISAETRNYLECIHQSIHDAASTVKNLQLFYTRDQSQAAPSATKLDVLIRQVVDMTRPKWKDEPEQRGRSITVDLQLRESPSVKLSATDFRVVLTNLLFNAVEAMPQGGHICIDLDQQGSDAVLLVSDNGSGMTDETLHRCFEPFFTTRSRGSGLGLSACYGLVHRAGGTIDVKSTPDNGTTFTVRFPTCDESTDRAVDPSTFVAGSCTMLVVEDDENVRNATEALLRKLGVQVFTASDGPSAIACINEKGPFDILVTDLGMASMDGRAVIDIARRLDPEQRVAVVSGWPKSDVLQRFRGTRPPDIVLQKPLTTASLCELVKLGDTTEVYSRGVSSN